MTACSTCGEEHQRKGQRNCVDCHNAYMRQWRKTNRLEGESRKRDNARSIASVYKKRGEIVQQPCTVCGDPDSQMHHPDHELPRLVVWLCRPCHLAWHAHWRVQALALWNRWLAKNARREAA